MRRMFVLSLLPFIGCGKAVDSGEPGGPGAGADTGDERCFNGADDDDDDLIDCADPSCVEVATCVPVAQGLEAGALVPVEQPCPAGFEAGELAVHRDLVQGECLGCDCTAGTTGCTATVWYYEDQATCDADGDQTGGVESAVPVTFTCQSSAPISDTFIYGLRADVAVVDGCTASGEAEPGPMSWGRTMKFCRASVVGGGCEEDAACVGRQEQEEAQCALAAGSAGCAGFASSEADWYTGVDDTRACGDCASCTSSGSCDGVSVQVGIDYTCEGGPGTVGDDVLSCFGSTYSPPVFLTGAPTQATTCEGHAVLGTEATPTGQQTLCCAPM